MKIAVPASDAALDARIERKLGEATYLLVIKTDDMTFKAVEAPPISGGAGSGIQAVSIILEMGAKAINSYVIGETLLKMGVSLFGVTALMLTWVSVGLIQLPVEIATLGTRFAVLRNAAAFVIAMIVAVLTAILAGF